MGEMSLHVYEALHEEIAGLQAEVEFLKEWKALHSFFGCERQAVLQEAIDAVHLAFHRDLDISAEEVILGLMKLPSREIT
jgi:hypothetical protein